MRLATVVILCCLGCTFSLTGAVGMLRMPDLYLRIQCSTVIVTMGSVPMLLALVVAEGPMTPYGGRALVVGILLLLMGPISSHALARASDKAEVPMWDGSVADEPREQHS